MTPGEHTSGTTLRDDAAATLAGIWTELLGVPAGPDDDFFDLGGHSLLVVTAVARARAAGLTVRADQVFDHPTPRSLAHTLDDPPARPPQPTSAARVLDGDFPPSPELVSNVWLTSGNPWDGPPCLVPLIPDGRGEPLFCVHVGTGHVRFFASIARTLHAGRPVYGFEAIGYRARVRPYLSIAETAEHYLNELRAHQPRGPYHLLGLCSGAVIAYEMARRLRARDEEVAVLVLADPPAGMPMLDPGWGLADLYGYRLDSLRATEGLEDPVADLPEVLDRLTAIPTYYEPGVRIDDFYRLQVLWAATVFAQEHYQPMPYQGPVHLFANAHHETEVRGYWLPLLDRPTLHVADNRTTLGLLRQPLLATVLAEALALPAAGRHPREPR